MKKHEIDKRLKIKNYFLNEKIHGLSVDYITVCCSYTNIAFTRYSINDTEYRIYFTYSYDGENYSETATVHKIHNKTITAHNFSTIEDAMKFTGLKYDITLF
jgi:hypothetical protein